MDIGIDSEFGRLKSVFLHIPIEENFKIYEDDLKKYGYSSMPNHKKIVNEIWEYAQKLESLGIKVYTDEKYDELKKEFIKRYHKKFPNLIYFRDLIGIFGSDAIISQPYLSSRKGEHIYACELFKEMFNINYTFIDHGTFEPTDTMWIDKNKIVINMGYRTEFSAAYNFRSLFFGKYYTIFTKCNDTYKVPQHIQGSKNIFDKDTIAIRHQLHQSTFQFNNIIHLDETEEIKNSFAMNIFNIGPNEIIMPENCPNTQQILEDKGITCHTSPMKYITAGDGGFTCITLPLERESPWN